MYSCCLIVYSLEILKIYIVEVFYMNENSSLKQSMENLLLVLVFISQTYKGVVINGLDLGENLSLLSTQHCSISLYPPVIVYSLT